MKRLSLSIAISLVFFLSTVATCPARQMTILVYPFENTGDRQYSWISAGMTDTIISDLARIRDISFVSNADRKKVFEEMRFIKSGLTDDEVMIKLGKLTGADIIFTGTYLVSGKKIRVNARLVNVETGKIDYSAKIDGTLDKIFDLQDRVVLSLLSDTERLSLPEIKSIQIKDEEKQRIINQPRPKQKAFELYAKGLEIKDSKPREALEYFKKAILSDKDYVDALISAGWTAGNTLNLFNEAIQYLHRADMILKARKDTDSETYADLMNNIGAVYYSKGDLDGALRYYKDSQRVQDRLGLQGTAGYASLLNNIGLLYLKKGNISMAGKYFRESYNAFVRAGYTGPERDKALENAKLLGY